MQGFRDSATLERSEDELDLGLSSWAVPTGSRPADEIRSPCGPDGALRVTELLDPYFSNTVKGIPSISQLFSEYSFLLLAVFSLLHRSPGPPLPFFFPKSASESPSPPRKSGSSSSFLGREGRGRERREQGGRRGSRVTLSVQAPGNRCNEKTGVPKTG